MAWDFILTDLLGNPVGQITNASERKVMLPHLRVPSVAFTIPLWDAYTTGLLIGDCMVKCYRTDPTLGTRTLVFNGPVVSVEETASQGESSVAVTASGPLWRLTKRLIPSSKGVSGTGYGTAASPIDLGSIARQIILDVNVADFSGIDAQASNITPSSTGWVGPYYLKVAAEAIAELSTGLSSFEYVVDPREPSTYGQATGRNWPKIGDFRAAPVIGALRPDAIFEYGTSRANVATYTRSVSRETMLNNAIVSVSGWPDGVEKNADGSLKYHLVERPGGGTPPVYMPTSADINARGLFEEVVNDAGILDDGIRQRIADLHVNVRKAPKQVITFTPATNARPSPFIDYNVGDTVRARAMVNGAWRFDQMLRIWGVTVNIDVNGNENIELEMVMP